MLGIILLLITRAYMIVLNDSRRNRIIVLIIYKSLMLNSVADNFWNCNLKLI